MFQFLHVLGHYLFIEASAPRQPGDNAQLQSPLFSPTTAKCLNFWFIMYGADIGNLRVYLRAQNSTSTATKIWDLFGDHGNSWMKGEVPFFSSKPFYVRFLILLLV